MPARDPSLALVLSGGGARGAFDVGVVEAVDRAGLRPGVVTGTSAGAITGAGVACGWPPERITALWTSLQTRDVLRPRWDLHRLVRLRPLLQPPHRLLGFGSDSTTETLLDVLGWTWLFHLRPLRELLVDELGADRLPVEDDVTLTLSAVQVESGRLVRFSNRPLPNPDRDRDPNVVVDLTVAERLLVAGASTEEPGPTPPASLGDVLALALDHVLREALLTDVDHARTVSALAQEAPRQTHHQPVEMVTVLPEEPIAGLGDLLDFEPEVAQGLIDSGRRVTTPRLEDAGWA